MSAIKADNGFTRVKPCTVEGVFNANRKLFTVTYPGNRWFDEDVKTHHKKIHET